ncbi:MAG TPA: AbrB/MazE/SpoVT family DNA-binding domain-containing protein [Candidatus Nanoarchaeia archaeon]|nr:AbrB/MazE/SpoVT family DNA-binding domain-containing protein [Candidatus Nanoarchaeia archaeon]
MRKYAKPVSCDSRGQLVIPKEVRKELSIEEGTGFWVFFLEKEGILLKRITDESVDAHDPVIHEMLEKSAKLGVEKANLNKTIQNYQKKEKGGFWEI